MKILYITIVLVFRSLYPLYAQTGVLPQLDTNSKVVQPLPSNQAPDDVLKKLSDLIHAGKYPEAQQLAAGLLIAYPNDQRLIKAKALLDKLPVATAAPAGNQPGTNMAPAQPGVAQYTGIDKVEHNSLIELGREAQATTDLDQQKILLHKFMDESQPFLVKYPNDVLLWQLRAAAALSLNDIPSGYDAGQKLLASGMADNDPGIQSLLSQLNLKGMLDKQAADNIKRFTWLLGIWDVNFTWKHGNGYRGKEDFVLEGTSIEGYQINTATNTRSIEPDLRLVDLKSAEISYECYLPAPGTEDMYLYLHELGGGVHGWESELSAVFKGYSWYPSGWQKVISFTPDNAGQVVLIIPSQDYRQGSKVPTAQPVTLTLTKFNKK